MCVNGLRGVRTSSPGEDHHSSTALRLDCCVKLDDRKTICKLKGSLTHPVVVLIEKPVPPSCSALCVPIPPPEHAHVSALRNTGAALQRNRRATESRVSSSPPSSLSQCYEHKGSASIGRSERPAPRRNRSPSPNTSARPLAVLKVANKRGKGIFSEHDERALVRLCATVESLLRSKAAEVSLLRSGMTERTLIRKSNNRGGAGGAWSNHAQVESTIMRLYSEASFPADAVALRRQLSKKTAAEHRQRALSDSTTDVYADLARKKSDGSLERHISDNGDEKTAVDNHVGRVHRRMPTEESELVDLGMSLFELSSEQLLSLVTRFFRNLKLTDMFQVCVLLRVRFMLFRCLLMCRVFPTITSLRLSR